VDTLLLNKAKTLLARIQPGVVEELEKLGGEFLPVSAGPHYTRSSGPKDKGKVIAAQVTVSYLIAKVHVVINMTMTCVPDEPRWKVIQCAYHCGPSDATDEVYFRICDNSYQGFHFHLRGYGGDTGTTHVPAPRAKPAISRDPLAFLALVEKFLGDNKALPLEVTP
jgi:hypothetical protein